LSLSNCDGTVVLIIRFLLGCYCFGLLFGFFCELSSGFLCGLLFLLFLEFFFLGSFLFRGNLGGFLFSSFLVGGNLLSLCLSFSLCFFLGGLSGERLELFLNSVLILEELFDGILSLVQFTGSSQSLRVSILDLVFFFFSFNFSLLLGGFLSGFFLL
jgi:hypothetical protein